MKSTDDFVKQIEHLDIDDFKNEDIFEHITIYDYLNALIAKNNYQPKDIVVLLNMERSYTYQILKGRRNPTRNFLIRIALLCHLTLDETQRMLTIGKRPVLYARNRFDAVIIYGIKHKLKEDEINTILKEIGETPLY